MQPTPSARGHGRFPGLVGVLLLCVAFLLLPFDSVWTGHAESVSKMRLFFWCGISALCALAGLLFIVARRRIPSGNLALLMASLAGCLLVSEMGLAVAGFKAPKRIVLRVPRQVPWTQVIPSLAGSPMQSGEGPPLKNGRGWQLNPQYMPDTDQFTSESSAPFPRRVLVIGDSFAYGVGASSMKATFAELADQALDDAAPTVVWDVGVPTTGQRSQFPMFEEFAPLLRPQVVVASMFHNDFADNVMPLGQFYVYADWKWVEGYEETPDGFIRLTPEAAYRRAFAPRVPREILQTLRTVSALSSVYHRLMPKEKLKGPAKEYQVGTTRGYKETVEWTQKLRDGAVALGAKFFVLLVPAPDDLGGPTDEYRDMQAVCRELNIDTIEVLADLTSADYVPWPDYHWNDRGQAKAATKLVQVLADTLPSK